MTIKSFLLSLISGITLLTAAPTVFGETYNAPMQVLENGTNSASYASAYFANSATVTPNGNQYTVTSTVTTDTSLGDYPVQMLSIDGSGVTTSRSQSGNKQTITYSFVTSDLKARHNANIKVDVDSINYHHNYTVGLVLDTANVPAPAASVTSADSTAASTSVAAVASSQTTTTSHVAATSSSHETREATSSAAQATTAESVTTNSATETSASSASASTSTAGKTDSEAHAATSSSAHKSTKAAKKSAPAQQKSADQTTDQAAALPVGLIIGAGLAIGILGALATVFLKRH
ncbi:NEAT domain-containing protein [Weissella cibaria]|uniref:NEAT domain-containing protein n=1 Tax=Weissella cibaria TaxID=137591 RepID=UPI0039838F08